MFFLCFLGVCKFTLLFSLDRYSPFYTLTLFVCYRLFNFTDLLNLCNDNNVIIIKLLQIEMRQILPNII